MKREYVRRIVVFGEYFKVFRKTLNKDALKKLYQVFTYIMTEEVVPSRFMAAISGVKGLYEIRMEYESNIYRVFCCFDEDALVVLFNGFQKKTQKTPRIQIDKAKQLMDLYFAQKKEGHGI